MNHPVILTCLVGHLTVGEVFRLRRALGAEALITCEETVAVLETRLGLTHRRNRTFDHVGRRMARLACRECGVPCRRIVRVCRACATEPGGYREMLSRRDVLLAGGVSRADLKRLRVVARTSVGAHLYWRHDVQQVHRSSAFSARGAAPVGARG